MILGFAHLTVHTASTDTVVKRLTSLGWKFVDAYRDVVSAPEKWPLMAMRASRHDLILLNGPIALEVVSHDTGCVDQPPRIMLDETEPDIRLLAHDIESEKKFIVDGLGFHEANNGRLEFSSPIPQWHVSLSIQSTEDAPADPPLDLAGPSCLAFYSTNPQLDAQRLEAIGCRDCTPLFEIELSGRHMSVLMLRSPSGVILELIKVNKGKTS